MSFARNENPAERAAKLNDLETDVSGKVNRSGDTMTGTLKGRFAGQGAYEGTVLGDHVQVCTGLIRSINPGVSWTNMRIESTQLDIGYDGSYVGMRINSVGTYVRKLMPVTGDVVIDGVSAGNGVSLQTLGVTRARASDTGFDVTGNMVASGVIQSTGAAIAAATFIRPGSYTVATLPSAATSGAGAMVYVSNESGGAVIAFSDGTNWRRVTDRAIVS